MNLPGFTAEDSIYRTDGGYRTAGAQVLLNWEVYPARLDRSARVINARSVEPIRLTCAPLTVCQPDPLEPFCETCTELDENCRARTYQYCVGVKIPNKLPDTPDPRMFKTR